MKKFIAISAGVTLVFLSSVCFETEALPQQAANATADLFHKPEADCQGKGANTGIADGGFVNAHLNQQQGQLIVNVKVRNGLPSTPYRVHLRCIGRIGQDGDLTTNANGVGSATFKVSSEFVPATFAIDMHSLPDPTEDFLISEPITLP